MFQPRQRMIDRRRGQALVEAALTLLVCLTTIIGLIEFSRAVWIYNLVSHLAREGTRYAIVRGKSTTPPATVTDIQNAVKKQAIGLDSSKLTINVSWIPDNKPGNYVKVAVQYSFKFMTPFLPTNTLTLKSASQVMVLH